MVRQEKNSFLFLVYLAGLSIIGFLATDMYLPAFDTMRVDLDTSKSNISASLSLFLGGYAIAQLMWGPISDKLGRPKAILMGLAIFVIASLGIYFTKHVHALLILRLVQAIGVCAAAVSWQALVIERYPSAEVNKVLASIMPLVALSPALAPLVGVFLLDYFSWRSIFIVLALLALLLIAYTFTLSKATAVERAMPGDAAKEGQHKSYFDLLRSKRYLGNVLIYAVCSGAFFAWLTGSPFFLKDLGYNESQIGFSFVPQTIAFMAGGYGYRLLSNRVEGSRLVPWLLTGYTIGLVGVFLITITVQPTLTLLLIPFCLMALCNGACYPIVVAQALKTFPNNSGKAAALQNTIQLGICFLASALVSFFAQTPLFTTTIVMLCTIPFAVLGYKWSLKA
ncbi:purine nucleoside transporter PunC [Sphingobacterium sp. UT-1RO-CII-1]|uniref:purine nucleoside transporter PunC n=1 Tax=Sphingobacterium sp. UT-1RO-CII-1 TaxID=2995225 RepID=UPI00227CBC53|nr:purine nucleoside transporter PunC [Sphingobacterium sp. UT-1RO-CII-1]MCY4779236.1 purine nucleoside transporter PunC [Sphingobacterium sp. UT-1RO-CII-1]